MENVQQYSGFRSFLKSNDMLSQGILLCGLAIIILMWLRRSEKRSKVLGRTVPQLKLKFLSPYGSADQFPSNATMKKTGLPIAAYFLENLQGHATIFQKEGLFYFRVGQDQYVVLTKAEYVQELLSKSVFLEKGDDYNMLHPWLGTGLLTSHGSKWKSRRKLLTHSFHFDILKDFVPIFDEMSKVLVSVLTQRAQEEWLDVGHFITLCSLDIICETTFGVHVGAQEESGSEYVQDVQSISQIFMERSMSPFLRFEAIFRMSSLGRQFKKVLKSLHGFTRKVIQQKKDAIISARGLKEDSASGQSETLQFKKKRKALMDLLLDIHMNTKEFTEEDIREEIDTFAFEGHDTTSMGMSWTLYVIGLYPEIQRNIHQELDDIFGDDRDRPVTVEDLREMPYLERVLKETQRLYPSVPVFSRRIHEDFNLGGYKVNKGVTLLVNTFLLHRNPEAFPNPEKFDPDRFLPENCANQHPYAFVPFSAGPRNCIGQRFAIMEEKTVISNVLRRFHVKSLENRDKIFPVIELVLRSHYPLKMKFTLRDPPL